MEARKVYEEQIMEKVRLLPEAQLAKVISMLDKLNEENRGENEPTAKKNYSEAIEKLWGMLAGEQGSSDEFAKRKAEEKALDR